jgi:hypothetical protein
MSPLAEAKEPPRNKPIGSSHRDRRVDRVVPFPVEGVGRDVQASELLIRDSATLWIAAIIDAALHGEENKWCSISFHLLVPGGK